MVPFGAPLQGFPNAGSIPGSLRGVLSMVAHQEVPSKMVLSRVSSQLDSLQGVCSRSFGCSGSPPGRSLKGLHPGIAIQGFTAGVPSDGSSSEMPSRVSTPEFPSGCEVQGSPPGDPKHASLQGSH